MKVPFPLIRVEELGQLYQDQKDFILIDASAGAQAFDQYRAGHLHGALFMDLETQLAAVPQNAADGGRHPLPQPKIFANILSESGILPSHRIVVYDDKNGTNAAARLWWMLKAIGHEQVQLLDGGLQAAKTMEYLLAAAYQPRYRHLYILRETGYYLSLPLLKCNRLPPMTAIP